MIDDAPKHDWIELIRWTALAVVMLVGLWLPGRGLPVVVLVILVSAFVGSLVRAAKVLPERVASHFNFALEADGWMSRRWYLIVMAGLAVVAAGVGPLVFFAVALGMGDAKMQRLALWLACLVLGLLLGVNEFTVRANMREPAELPRMVWALLGLFLLAIVLWGLAMGVAT